MTDPARKLWTLDEFLAFDDGTVTRYELIGGEIVAMAPRFGTHVALAARFALLIRHELSRLWSNPVDCSAAGTKAKPGI